MRTRIPVIQALLIAALVIGLLAGRSRDPMPPTKVGGSSSQYAGLGDGRL